MKLENITFNRDRKNFAATLSDLDKEYGLSVLDLEENEVEKATKLASEICSWLELNKQAARAFCASTLLGLKNETWLEEGEAPMTNEKFIETIELDGILAFSDGSFSLYFDDNDLFWGHAIVVEVEEGRLLDANLAG